MFNFVQNLFGRIGLAFSVLFGAHVAVQSVPSQPVANQALVASSSSGTEVSAQGKIFTSTSSKGSIIAPITISSKAVAAAPLTASIQQTVPVTVSVPQVPAAVSISSPTATMVNDGSLINGYTSLINQVTTAKNNGTMGITPAIDLLATLNKEAAFLNGKITISSNDEATYQALLDHHQSDFSAEQTSVENAQASAADNSAVSAVQAKQAKLDAINQQIAALNTKYASDISSVENNAGGTEDAKSAAVADITTQYNASYNILKAQYQTVEYGN